MMLMRKETAVLRHAPRHGRSTARRFRQAPFGVTIRRRGRQHLPSGGLPCASALARQARLVVIRVMYIAARHKAHQTLKLLHIKIAPLLSHAATNWSNKESLLKLERINMGPAPCRPSRREIDEKN